MGLAFTQSYGTQGQYKIIRGQITLPISSVSSAPYISAFHAMVQAAGWVHNGVYLTNGHEYVLTSPQGLACLCRIWDALDSSGTVRIQFVSLDGLRAGVQHRILYSAHTSYTISQLWVNCCSIFICNPGLNMFQTAMCGGVAFAYAEIIIPTGCSVPGTIDPTVAFEFFWSSGNEALLGGFADSSFRTTWAPQFDYCCCYNGDIRVHRNPADFNIAGQLCIPPPMPPWFNWNVNFVELTWPDGTPIYCEPWLACGLSDDTANPILLGQMWDAMFVTKPCPLESIQYYGNFAWINYMNSPNPVGDYYRSDLYSLWLLDAPGGQVVHGGAYVY
jgi:hypothetical protein